MNLVLALAGAATLLAVLAAGLAVRGLRSTHPDPAIQRTRHHVGILALAWALTFASALLTAWLAPDHERVLVIVLVGQLLVLLLGLFLVAALFTAPAPEASP